jgi:hypothetical protein
LVDGHLGITTASLGVVTAAGEVAHALVELLAIDRGAAEADTVVLETSIAEAVALALGDTLLNGHVGVGLAGAVDEGVGARDLVTVEATSVDVGLEGVKTRGELDVPSLRGLNESQRRSSDDVSKRRHVGKNGNGLRRIS